MDPSELSGLPKLIWNGLIGELGYADNPTVFAVCAVLCVVVPYLLGSINFAVIFSRRMYAMEAGMPARPICYVPMGLNPRF